MSQLPPEFDYFQPSDYDPQYTADISKHMNVPEHLDVSGADDSMGAVQFSDMVNHHVTQMTVPDKIIVLGICCLLCSTVCSNNRSLSVSQKPNPITCWLNFFKISQLLMIICSRYFCSIMH